MWLREGRAIENVLFPVCCELVRAMGGETSWVLV
jgi:hypothetical protein